MSGKQRLIKVAAQQLPPLPGCLGRLSPPRWLSGGMSAGRQPATAASLLQGDKTLGKCATPSFT